MIWWSLLACGLGDPELESASAALAAWEAGNGAMEQGRPAEALQAFRRARESRPDDLVLAAWEAEALAQTGDPAAAAEQMLHILQVRNNFPEGRYHLAGWLVKLGRHREASEQLKRAIDQGGYSVRDVADDPAFSEIVGHPDYPFIPPSPLTVAVDGPGAAMFWGSELSLRFRVLGAGHPPIRVEAPPVQAPLQLLSVMEDDGLAADGPLRDVTWTWRVVGAADTLVGPVQVVAGPRRTTLDAISLVTTAPPGKAATMLPLELALPSVKAGDHQPPAAWTDAGRFYVLSRPQDKVELSPVIPTIRYEHRTLSKVDWLMVSGALDDRAVSVKIQDAGSVLLEARLSR